MYSPRKILKMSVTLSLYDIMPSIWSFLVELRLYDAVAAG